MRKTIRRLDKSIQKAQQKIQLTKTLPVRELLIQIRKDQQATIQYATEPLLLKDIQNATHIATFKRPK